MIRPFRLGVALVTAAAGCLAASGIVETPAGAHRLKLGPYVVPPARTVGLIATVRINGGPPLRLLLDSGADSIVLDGKAARKSGCLGGSDLDLVGAGGPAAVRKVRAQTVQIGDLTLADVPVLITGQRIGEGIQGALPLSLFSGFLIRLDIPGKVLQLLPYPAAQPESGKSIDAIASNHLLFVRATVNDMRDGYFLLDTGAAYSAISQTVARELRISETLLSERVSLQGGTRAVDAALLGRSIRLHFPDRNLDSGPIVAIDLSASSAYHNFEIAGLIGYPALSGSVLLVSYRDRLIRIEPR